MHQQRLGSQHSESRGLRKHIRQQTEAAASNDCSHPVNVVVQSLPRDCLSFAILGKYPAGKSKCNQMDASTDIVTHAPTNCFNQDSTKDKADAETKDLTGAQEGEAHVPRLSIRNC